MTAIAMPKNDPGVNIFSGKPGKVEKSFTFGEHWTGCARAVRNSFFRLSVKFH